MRRRRVLERALRRRCARRCASAPSTTSSSSSGPAGWRRGRPDRPFPGRSCASELQPRHGPRVAVPAAASVARRWPPRPRRAGRAPAEATPREIARVCGDFVELVCRWVLVTPPAASSSPRSRSTSSDGRRHHPDHERHRVLGVRSIGRRLIRRTGARSRKVTRSTPGPMPTSAWISTSTVVVLSGCSRCWRGVWRSFDPRLDGCYEVVPLLASAGVATVALVFGAQHLVRDFLRASSGCSPKASSRSAGDIDVGEQGPRHR